MKHITATLLLALGLILVQPAGGQALELNTQVQDGLIAAEAVRGAGVDRALFDGKPVLVVFFASW